MTTSAADLPAVSVIVLNWNGAAHLPRCLDALAAQTWRDFEVLVVDNASTDGSVDGAEARWSEFQFIHLERNLGFAAGNNQGAVKARGGWLAFLNNDAFPHSNWLERLLQAAAEHPEYSFFASKLVSASDPSRIQAAGDTVHVSGAAWSLDSGCPVAGAQLHPAEVFSACAAASMYDRLAFEQAGGFCEPFVSHLEDVDLGFRLRLLGHRCLYIPAAVVEHVGSASYGLESRRTVYQVQRNLVWLYLTNMPGKLYWKYLPAHAVLNLFFLVYYSFKGLGGAVWQAKFDALAGLPAALSRRREVQAGRKVDPGQIDRSLDHGLLSPYLLGRRGKDLRQQWGKPGSGTTP